MIENGLNKKAIIGKHLGEPLCLWTACGCHVDTTGGGGGAVVRGGEEKGETEREEKEIQRLTVGGGGESCTAPPAV